MVRKLILPNLSISNAGWRPWSESCEPSAIDVDNLSGHECRCLTGEKDHGPCDVFRCAPAAERTALLHPRIESVIVDKRLGKFRGDVSRSDRVHADVARCPLYGKRLRELPDRALRRGIGRSACACGGRHQRSDIDDAPATFDRHQLSCELAAELEDRRGVER